MRNGSVVLRILKFLRPVWKTALITSIIIIVRAFAEVLSVYFLAPAVTAVTSNLALAAPVKMSFWQWLSSDESSSRVLRSVLGWMLASQLFLGVMIYLRTLWDTKLSMRAVYHIRAGIYDQLQRAKLTYHDKMSSGQLINRSVNDLQAVRHFMNLSVIGTCDIFASLTFYLGLLYLRAPGLMLAALIPLPLWYFVIYRFSNAAQPLCQDQQEWNDKLMTNLSENLGGVHVVRAFAAEKYEISKYAVTNGRLLDAMMKSVKLQSRLTPTLKIIATTAHVGLFAYAATLVGNKSLAVGDLLLLGAAMNAILGKLQQINAIVEAFQKAMVSSKRLFEILDLPDQNTGLAPELKIGEIEFKDVCFSYNRTPVLHGLNGKIRGGKVTALVGPTGSGKTTLASLIGRLYDPVQGEVWLDGHRSVDLHPCELRRKVGYVFQETFLFSSTVRDNIRYGRTDVSEEMIRSAARVAMADQFIERLPNGYDTWLGDKGVALSGGQRQRLALARALVYDPTILILDEATTALDAATEEVIHERLDKAFEGRTVLLIANRLSSIQTADFVLVMQEGRITQTGTHDELVACEGHYREIISIQDRIETGEEFLIKLDALTASREPSLELSREPRFAQAGGER